MDAQDAVRERARQIAGDYLARGDYLRWFDVLYASADGDASTIPWAHLTVNPELAAWIEREQPRGNGRRAIVIGCGLGDDAEALAALGFDVTAFDVSASAIAWCRRRFASTRVNYVEADLFHLPTEWHGMFDFVLESYTLQSLPIEMRPAAIAAVARFVASVGTLLVLCRGRDDAEPVNNLPWPLSRSELAAFGAAGLREIAFEDYLDAESPPVRRFRIAYGR